MPVYPLFQWGFPVIAFSGEHTPMMALYAFGAERDSRTGITIAPTIRRLTMRFICWTRKRG